MGSGASTSAAELEAFKAAKSTYEAGVFDSQDQAAAFEELKRVFLLEMGRSSTEVRDAEPVQECRCDDEGSSDVAQQLLSMTSEERDEHAKAVLAAVLEREEAAKAAGVGGADYSKSFSGTKQDTQVEKDFESMLRGPAIQSMDIVPDLLKPIECSWKDMEALRAAGKWMKFLGHKGCYMWIHSFTREVTAIRPPDFEEEAIEEGDGEAGDPSGGLFSCSLPELPEVMERTITEEKMTPLLLDPSAEGKVTAYFSYKAILVDVSVLGVGYQKSGVRISDLMETVRASTVSALKAGTTLALRLGHLTADQANFKKKLCKRDVFPNEIFQEGGKKLFAPKSKPRCNLLFREQDMESGQCLVKEDGFRFCAITSLGPRDIQEKLGESLPTGYMKPIYVFC